MSNTVPVVMYHSVGRVLDDWAWRNLTATVDVFEDHLRALQRAGYRSATLDEFAAHIDGTRPLEGKRVVLTFDDGYLDNWSHAVPLLERYGFTGTVLVTVEFVDPSGVVRPQRKPGAAPADESSLDVRAFMSWDELRRAAASGVLDVQSHAMTHTWYPVSAEVVDFHHPGDAHYWLDWNAFPESKTHYLKHLGTSRVPWGVPVYEHEKSLKCRRFFPDPAEAEHMVGWVTARGGDGFFAAPDWKTQLRTALLEFRTGHETRGRMETDVERVTRMEWELTESQRVIAAELGRDVSYFVWPGGGYDDTSMQIAQRHYRATTVSGKERWRYHNRAGENPGLIVRRGAPSFEINGETVFAPGRYLVDTLDEFRGAPLARRRRQVHKMALLAASRAHLWPRHR
jgi:peptidoglycan/xylan/chitin deacetylase (PgdA/CDA1 family)